MYLLYDLLPIIVLIIVFGLPSFFLKRECFFSYTVFNFFTFFVLEYIIQRNSEKMYALKTMLSIYCSCNFDMSYIIPLLYTPIYAYFISDYTNQGTLLKKLFFAFNTVAILVMFFILNGILLVYPYIVLSLIVFLYFKKENPFRKAMQATTVALGMYCLFNTFPYFLVDVCEGLARCSFLFSSYHLVKYEISGLEILVYLIFLLNIILAILVVFFFCSRKTEISPCDIHEK